MDERLLAEEIAKVHGALVAHDAVIAALFEVLSPLQLEQLAPRLQAELEAAQTLLLNTRASDAMLDSLQTHGQRHAARLVALLEHLANIRRVAPGILPPPGG